MKIIVLSFFIITILRLFYLQIIKHQRYLTQAVGNFIVKKNTYPERGAIFDRNTKPLLINHISFDLVVNPSLIKEEDTIVIKKILHLSGKEILDLVKEKARKIGYYLPSVIKPYLTEKEAAIFYEHNFLVSNGFYLQKRARRKYLYKEGSHVLGYIGEVDESFMKIHPKKYELGDFVGVNGLENYYEDILAGQKGKKLYIRDNLNRIVGSFDKGKYDTTAIIGKNIHISLDIDLQVFGEKLMQNKVGSIVAIEPKTGEILSLISSPSFDANKLSNAERNFYYAKLSNDKTLPLFNRALKGLYSPGSTIKPLMGLIGLDLNLIDTNSSYNCRGVYTKCSKKIRCEHSNIGHASNLHKAITNSCNSYFLNVFKLILSNNINSSSNKNFMVWKSYLNSFGLGKKYSTDIPGVGKGFVPDSNYYKKYFGRNIRFCNIASLAIGQAELQATPLQLANLTCVIANKGYYYQPHFIRKIVDNIKKKKKFEAFLKKYKKKYKIKEEIPLEFYETIKESMYDVVNHGTAFAAKIPGIEICAKTGTTQNKRLINNKVYKLPSHSLFIAFAPKDNPQIAIAVVIENAGYGSKWAAPIGSLIIEKYLKREISPKRKYLVNKITRTNLIPKIYLDTINK